MRKTLRKLGKQWENQENNGKMHFCGNLQNLRRKFFCRGQTSSEKKSEIYKVTRFHCHLTQKYRNYMPCSIHIFSCSIETSIHRRRQHQILKIHFISKPLTIKYLLENDGITKYQEWWRYSSVENDGIFSTSMNHRNTSNSNKEKQSIDPFTASRRYHMVKIHVIKVVGFYFGNGLLMIQSPVYTRKKQNYTYMRSIPVIIQVSTSSLITQSINQSINQPINQQLN